MIVGRIFGWLLIVAGAIVLLRDLLGWFDTKVFAPIVLGQLWFDLAPGSLNLLQAVIQRYVHPALWDPVVTSVLFLWAWVVLMALGALFVLVFRPRGGNGGFQRRRRR